MTPTPKTPKQIKRSAIRQALALLSPGYFHSEGEKAAALLAGTPQWKSSSTVLLFCSLPGEIDMEPLLNLAFDQGKNVFMPRVQGQTMVFYAVNRESAWETSDYGIREPAIT
ncbi:hypothetical protein FACS1894151_09290 [Spirochaetia bacterium]|nr:hypothetical protein FACS1894151_09290 [Spirochaetia bacterium]